MNLPSAFIERTRALMGDEAYSALEATLQEEASVSIRVNSAKWNEMPQGVPVPWASAGMYLSRRPFFTFDPLFHAGCYYVQEASSMFLEQVMCTYVTTPVVMLDLCAAPGGKSTHARSLLPDGSLLVANEVIRNRSQVLAENLIKWGHSEVIVTNNDPSDFNALTNLFDVILTDVPCSGEGMFRKDPVAVEEWSVDNVTVCQQRQHKILTDVWPSLKPGGLLIYSTCTYNKEEDEENVAWIARELGADVLEVPVAAEWGITGNLVGEEFPVYRFLPHRTKGEGLFLAVLRKSFSEQLIMRNEKFHSVKGKNVKRRKQPLVVPREAEERILHADDFLFEVKGTQVIAFPKQHVPIYAALQQTLHILHAGITVGEMKGKDFVPDHSLAMSTALNKETFPQAELTYEQAIAYLRKEALVLDASIPRGYVLLTYQQVPLGFAKNIGNRANNLYPQEWRIRSCYLHEDGPVL